MNISLGQNISLLGEQENRRIGRKGEKEEYRRKGRTGRKGRKGEGEKGRKGERGAWSRGGGWPADIIFCYK